MSVQITTNLIGYSKINFWHLFYSQTLMDLTYLYFTM